MNPMEIMIELTKKLENIQNVTCKECGKSQSKYNVYWLYNKEKKEEEGPYCCY